MGEQEIDSQLKEMLDLLRPVARRSPDAMRRSRSRFYADLDVYFPVEASYSGSVKAPSFRPATVAARFKPLSYRPAIIYLTVVVFVLVALFGGGYATASASGDALPGDALYPVKVNLEQARLALTINRVRKGELHLEFAQRRMEEINALAALGRYEGVALLAKQFNHQLSLALGAAQNLENLKPEEASRLEEQITQMLGLFQVTFNQVVTNAPPALVPGLQETFERATQVNPPPGNTNNPNANGNNSSGNGNPNPGNANSNANPNTGNANNNGNPAQPNNNNSSNVHSNSNGAPGTVITGNSNENSSANPNSNKDKTKDTGKGKDKEKDKDKDNNGKNK
jgi:hypothetical protein